MKRLIAIAVLLAAGCSPKAPETPTKQEVPSPLFVEYQSAAATLKIASEHWQSVRTVDSDQATLNDTEDALQKAQSKFDAAKKAWEDAGSPYKSVR